MKRNAICIHIYLELLKVLQSANYSSHISVWVIYVMIRKIKRCKHLRNIIISEKCKTWIDLLLKWPRYANIASAPIGQKTITILEQSFIVRQKFSKFNEFLKCYYECRQFIRYFLTHRYYFARKKKYVAKKYL